MASKPEDIALGLHTGNSHRAGLAAALRGEPRRDCGSSGHAPDRGGRLAGRVASTGVRGARPAQAEPIKMPPPAELSMFSPQESAESGDLIVHSRLISLAISPRSSESYYVGLNSSVRGSKANATPARGGGGARGGHDDQKATGATRADVAKSSERMQPKPFHPRAPIAMPGRDRNSS